MDSLTNCRCTSLLFVGFIKSCIKMLIMNLLTSVSKAVPFLCILFQ